MKSLWRALQFYRGDWPRIVLAFGLLLLTTAAALFKPWPLAWIVDLLTEIAWSTESTEADFKKALLSLTLVLLAVHVIHALCGATLQGLVISTGLHGLARIRRAVFEGLLRLTLRRLQGSQAGDLIYRATWDTYSFQTLFTQGVFLFCGAMASVAAMTAVMWRLNPMLTLVALGIVPILLMVMNLFGPRLRQRASTAQAADALVAGSVQQIVANLHLVQSCTRETSEAHRFADRTEVAYSDRWLQHRTEVIYLTLVACVFAIGTAAIVWVGAGQVQDQELTLGQLLVFLAYLAQLYEPLNQLSHVGATVANARAGSERVLEFLAQAEPVHQGTHKPKSNLLAEASGPSLVFDNVHFAYEPAKPVLRGISLSVSPGESIALIGPSGAGKSTLIQLIPRFLDPDSGSITLDGHDLRQWNLEALRRHVGLVLQEPVLLPTTIEENIAYGRMYAAPADIEAAARAANAHEFIVRLPKGYQTVVGDGAVRLSVGEKQRIDLARAFLKDAPILLLDEPTSALDSESESLVLSSLARLKKGRITLMVAHRMQTILNADKVAVLDRGTLVEWGTPEELLRQDGYFARVKHPVVVTT